MARSAFAMAVLMLLTAGCSMHLGQEGGLANKPGCPRPAERGRPTKQALVREYVSALRRGCEDEIWSLLARQGDVADAGRYFQGKAGLHRLVQAYCGLNLVNVKIRYGKNTPWPYGGAEYDHDIGVTADFSPKPGPHARFAEILQADHRAGRWKLRIDTVVKKSDDIEQVPGEGRCFDQELVGQVRDELSSELRPGVLQVLPRDLDVHGDEATLKVQLGTWGEFYEGHFKRSNGKWTLGSLKMLDYYEAEEG
jgi:hypothetical protein